MLELQTPVSFMTPYFSARRDGVIVGRTREACPRYDIRVWTVIFVNIPGKDVSPLEQERPETNSPVADLRVPWARLHLVSGRDEVS
jgi:hypothetical protein